MTLWQTIRAYIRQRRRSDRHALLHDRMVHQRDARRVPATDHASIERQVRRLYEQSRFVTKPKD